MKIDDLNQRAKQKFGEWTTEENRQQARNVIERHWESTKAAFWGMPLEAWLAPFVCIFGILLIYLSPWNELASKPTQEIVAPVIIGMTAIVSLFVHRWVGETFTLILACFAWALFIRELHIPLSNNGFYIAIFAIAWWVSNQRFELAQWFSYKWIRIFLGGAFWTYLITKVFDRHYVSFLPAYNSWNNHVEETLEACGHGMVFALVIATLRIGLTRKSN